MFCLFLPAVRTKPWLHPVHVIPAFYICCTILAAALMVSFDPWQLVGTAITIAIGVVAYVVTRSLNPTAVASRLKKKAW